jgi:hypothetical protein
VASVGFDVAAEHDCGDSCAGRGHHVVERLPLASGCDDPRCTERECEQHRRRAEVAARAVDDDGLAAV